MKSLLGSMVSRPQLLGKRRLSVLGTGVLVVLSTEGLFPGGRPLTTPGLSVKSVASRVPDRKAAKKYGQKPGAALTAGQPCKASGSWIGLGLAEFGQRCRWGPWVPVSWALMVWMLPRIFFWWPMRVMPRARTSL